MCATCLAHVVYLSLVMGKRASGGEAESVKTDR